MNAVTWFLVVLVVFGGFGARGEQSNVNYKV
jgi:hypothetical protein